MVTKSFKTTNSDIIGALASGICLLHCIATPFIFIAQTYSATEMVEVPVWWGAIDILFLVISFFAVYWSTVNSAKSWMTYALWTSWVGLSLIILNEKIGLLPIPEFGIYIPAIALVVLHLYNKRYCQCKDENCCVPAS